MDTSTVVAVASPVAAWFAALFSYRSYRVSRSQARLAERAELRRNPDLALYLARASFEMDEMSRNYAMQITISNRSETANSVSRVELEVVLKMDESGPLSVLRFPHDSTLLSGDIACEAFVLPKALGPKDTAIGWLGFAVLKRLISDAEVIRHSIVVADASDSETHIDVGSPSQVLHE